MQLAEIPGVARDSVRNEGTREINYGILWKYPAVQPVSLRDTTNIGVIRMECTPLHIYFSLEFFLYLLHLCGPAPNNFILLQFGLTCPIYFLFLGAILKANNSGLPLLPGRLATIPSQPRTLAASLTLWPTASFIQPQNGPKRNHHPIVVYGPLTIINSLWTDPKENTTTLLLMGRRLATHVYINKKKNIRFCTYI
jgi:hypothetical protein